MFFRFPNGRHLLRRARHFLSVPRLMIPVLLTRTRSLHLSPFASPQISLFPFFPFSLFPFNISQKQNPSTSIDLARGFSRSLPSDNLSFRMVYPSAWRSSLRGRMRLHDVRCWRSTCWLQVMTRSGSKFFILHSSFFIFQKGPHPMQLVVPSAVRAAVMMLATTWRTALQNSLFFIVGRRFKFLNSSILRFRKKSEKPKSPKIFSFLSQYIEHRGDIRKRIEKPERSKGSKGSRRSKAHVCESLR